MAALLKAGLLSWRCRFHRAPSLTSRPLPASLLPGKKAVPSCQHAAGVGLGCGHIRGSLGWNCCCDCGTASSALPQKALEPAGRSGASTVLACEVRTSISSCDREDAQPPVIGVLDIMAVRKRHAENS